MGSMEQEVQEKIQDLKNRDSAVWDAIVTHSRHYEEALGLSTNDLEFISRLFDGKVFHSFLFQERGFHIIVKSIKGTFANKYWYAQDYVVMVKCVTDRKPNVAFNDGQGGTVTALTDTWYRWVLAHMKKDSLAHS